MSSRQKAQIWPYPRYRFFQDHMRAAASGWFAAKDYPVDHHYPFILDSWDHWQRNIILPEVAAYIEDVRQQRAKDRQGFPLHKYVHHGLSSQALLFNLAGPLVVRNDLQPLLDVMRAAGVRLSRQPVSASFEFEDRAVFNEDSGQPTSIDLVLTDEAGKPCVFVECKFTEAEFGGCSVFAQGDCDGRNPANDFPACYLHHIGRRYWELLDQYGFLNGPLRDDMLCVLSNHYQFFRCLLTALHYSGTFVVLSDSRSPVFECTGKQGQRRGLLPLLLELVPEPLRGQVASISVQDLVTALEQSNKHEWLNEFKRKYGMT